MSKYFFSFPFESCQYKAEVKITSHELAIPHGFEYAVLPKYIPQPQLNIQLWMLDLDVLVERPLRPVRLLAGLNRAPVMSLDFPSSPPESLLPIVLALDPSLDLIAFLL